MLIAMVALAAALTPAPGVPTTWTPTLARLSARIAAGEPGAYELLRTGLTQDPVDIGLEWPAPQLIESLTVDFASLGGRVYEPDCRAQSLQVREGAVWRTIPAALTIDYASTGALAPLQGRGTARWTYRFVPCRVSAVRVSIAAPAHLDPGFQCIAVAAIRAVGPPTGAASHPSQDPAVASVGTGPETRRSTGGGEGLGGAVAGSVTIRGPRPGIPAWLEPGADLAAPASGAAVRSGNPTVIRWPRPLMVGCIRWHSGSATASAIEFEAGGEWRPAEAPVRDGPSAHFTPVATSGLRVHFAGGRGGGVSVHLDGCAQAYARAAEASRTDMLGERFRALPRRDLAAMGSLLLPIDFAKAAIGRPADLLETMVAWTGAFWMVEQSECVDPRTGARLPVQAADRWFAPAVGTSQEPVGADWMRVHSHYLDGWRPAVVTAYDSAGVHYEQTAFVTAPGSGPYGTVARVSATNRSRRPVVAAWTYALGRRRMYNSAGEAWTPFLSDPQPTGYTLDADCRTVRSAAGEVMLHSFQPGRWEGTPRENHFVVPLALEPGETRTLAFLAPCVTEPVRDVAAVRAMRPEAALAAFRAYWDGFLAGAASLDLPEPRLNDVYRNLLTQCAIIALDGDAVRYGAYAYEAYFGVEEGWPAVALAQYGLSEYARRIAGGMMSAEALDKRNYHHQYRNGLAPWYAITVYRLTGDTEWLRSLAPVLRECAEWTMATTAANKDTRYGGILPRHVYGGDISMPAYSFYSNATCWRGLHDTALAFEALGDAALAQRYRAAAAAYRARLMDLADSLVDRSGGLPFLPMAFDLGSGAEARGKEPAYPVLASESPSSDTWAYIANYWNLFAPMLLEVRLFEQADARAAWIPTYIEQRGGVLTGLARFSRGYDCIYGKGYIESLLEQGRREEFLTSLYGLFAHGASRSLASFPEVSGVFPLRTDNLALYREHQRERWSWLFRPTGHWVAGWQNQEGEPLSAGPGMALQLLRMALVREDYAEDPPRGLRLLDGAPAHWFAPGKRIAVRGLRSFFGPVSFTVTRTAVRATATVDLGAAARPARIVLRLPDAAGRPIRRVAVLGAQLTGSTGTEVMLSDVTGHIEVRATY